MAKKEAGKTNFRVVIEPTKRLYWFSNDEERKNKLALETCKAIVSDVKRHVDGVDRIEIEFDTNYVCEHCNAQWTEESDEYNGGCCAKDQEMHETTKVPQ